jgi:HEAT repeat protein
MVQELASSEKRDARKYLTWFEGTNAASYILISGQMIILLALRLGADNFFVGLISSFQYIAFFFMLIGRAMVGHIGLRRMMCRFWILRSLLLVPVLFVPFFAAAGHKEIGLLLIALALLGFHIFRGIAIIGFNPILGMVMEQRTMGSYLSRLQIVNQIATLVFSLIVALSIGKSAPLWRYAFFIGLGIVLGLLAGAIITKFPDPVLTGGGKDDGFWTGIRTALKRSDFRRFIIHFFLLSLVTGMAVPFIIVYAKEVYLRSDQTVMLLTVVGGFGAIAMGLLSRLLLDRIGAKPLYMLYTMLFTVSLIPLVIAPDLDGGMVFFLLAFVFFFYYAGQLGGQVSSKNYFYAITDKTEHLNLGIVYQMTMGVGNAVGALTGGALLGRLLALPMFSLVDAYRIYFGTLLFFFLVMMATALFIKDAGRYTVGNALSIIFSPRDLRAVVLLDKLDRSEDVQQEMKVLDDIAEVGSPVAVDELLEKLKSPRFYVRARALRALEAVPVNQDITKVLIREVKKRTYTTAHIAARIIGRKRLKAGEAVLISALRSPDYLLKANAMIALARIGGSDKRSLIEGTLERSHNPMVIMHGAVALQLLGDIAALPALAGLLKRKDPPSFLRDEIILSMAALLSMERWFYPLYSLFQSKRRDGVDELLDRFNSGLGKEQKDEFADLHLACSLILKQPERFLEALIPVFKRLPLPHGLESELLVQLASDPELLRFERLRFFLAAMSVRFLLGGGSDHKKRSRKHGKRLYRRKDDPIDL